MTNNQECCEGSFRFKHCGDSMICLIDKNLESNKESCKTAGVSKFNFVKMY